MRRTLNDREQYAMMMNALNGNGGIAPGMMMFANRMNEKSNERDARKALEALNGGVTSADSSYLDYAVPAKMDNTVSVSGNIPAASYASGTAQTPISSAAAGQGDIRTRVQNILNGGNKYTADNVDASVDVYSKPHMDIMNAKNEYELARQNGNEQGMLAASAKAEAARQYAAENNIPLMKSLQSSGGGSYADALQELEATKKAQNGYTTANFMNGTHPSLSQNNQDNSFNLGSFADYVSKRTNPNWYGQNMSSTPNTVANAINAGTSPVQVPTAAQASANNYNFAMPSAADYLNAKKKTSLAPSLFR